MAFFASLNGNQVVWARIVVPMYGVWHADVKTANEIKVPDTGNALVLGDFAGTCFTLRGGSFAGSRTDRLLGGAGGWRKILPAKFYSYANGVMASMVLGDAAKECGESVTVSADASVGAQFVREQGPAGRVLNAVSGAEWFVGFDGVTVSGPRTGGDVGVSFSAIAYSVSNGQMQVGSDSYAAWLPGKTVTAFGVTRTISVVVHTVDREEVRTELLFT